MGKKVVLVEEDVKAENQEGAFLTIVLHQQSIIYSLYYTT